MYISCRRSLGQQHTDTGPDFLDSANGPIIREIHEDGTLTCTQGDIVMRTEAYDLDRAYAHQQRQQASEGPEGGTSASATNRRPSGGRRRPRYTVSRGVLGGWVIWDWAEQTFVAEDGVALRLSTLAEADQVAERMNLAARRVRAGRKAATR